MDTIFNAALPMFIAGDVMDSDLVKCAREIEENVAKSLAEVNMNKARGNILANLLKLAVASRDFDAMKDRTQQLKLLNCELLDAVNNLNMWRCKETELRKYCENIIENDNNEAIAAQIALLSKKRLPKCNKKAVLIVSPSEKPVKQPIKKKSKRYTKPATVRAPPKEPEFAQIRVANNEQPKLDTENVHTLIKASKFKYEYLVGPIASIDRKIQNREIVFHEHLDVIAEDFQDRISTLMKDKVGKNVRQLKSGFTYKPNNDIDLDEIISIYANSHA